MIEFAGKSTLLNHLFGTNFREMDAFRGRRAYIEAAENMLEDDVASNKGTETFGSSLMRQHAKNPDKLFVLTHCNTRRYDFR
ncbi:hypothetical protein HID58_058150 [Brassica napus]|uniref:G domain-containing protein n=1 Tax=Brassica napus TaxID=3708 RepID=A0ABQ7ZPC4_BRANA|nr:hypothetical protein HID58_058150 [Brassica napus]